MRVLIAADYATPASGNFVASLVELGRRMQDKEHEIVFCFPISAYTTSDKSWTNWLRKEGFTVYLFDKAEPEEKQLAFLKAVISKHDIDLIHIHFGMFHHVILHHVWRLGVKVLVHDHMGFSPNVRKKTIASCMLKSLVYRVKHIGLICVAPEKFRVFRFARRWLLPNGLSFIRNVDHSATREECRTELGLQPEDRLCLFLGWELYIKGLDIAVKAVNSLHEKNPHLLLGIIGVGTPPKKQRLDSIRQKTGVDPESSWIRYLPSREDMFAYHRAADVYLSASRSEAFSYGLLETISQNTPAAVSDIEGTAWSKGYSKAFIYPTEDYLACADAIQSALDAGRSPSNYAEMLDRYSIERWCNSVYSIYKKMLGIK